MFIPAVRFTKPLVVLLVVLSISVGAGIVYYFAQGGNLARLKSQTARAVENGKELADLKALLDKGKELGEQITGLLAREPAKTGAPADSKAAEAPAEGEIRVYFAPCQPANPFGIDDAFLGLLKGAKRSIHCAFFEFELPAAAEALIAKHKEGVDVKIVSDSNYNGREAIRSCMAAGIPVVFDNRNAYMHDKFCVVDDALVWTGSTNATENCMYRNDNNSLLISSPRLAQDYAAEFDEMFRLRAFGKKSPRNTPYPEVVVGNVKVECYFAPEDQVERAIVKELEAAQLEIDVMAFSFTSTGIAKAMTARMEKGVKVRAVFDERQAGMESSQDEYLAKRGASVRLDRNRYAMHNKVIIIDAGTVITGSYNFTKSADTQNDENVLILHSPDIAATYQWKFESIFSAN